MRILPCKKISANPWILQGNHYTRARREQWTQYVGNVIKLNFFLNTTQLEKRYSDWVVYSDVFSPKLTDRYNDENDVVKSKHNFAFVFKFVEYESPNILKHLFCHNNQGWSSYWVLW